MLQKTSCLFLCHTWFSFFQNTSVLFREYVNILVEAPVSLIYINKYVIKHVFLLFLLFILNKVFIFVLYNI